MARYKIYKNKNKNFPVVVYGTELINLAKDNISLRNEENNTFNNISKIKNVNDAINYFKNDGYIIEKTHKQQ